MWQCRCEIMRVLCGDTPGRFGDPAQQVGDGRLDRLRISDVSVLQSLQPVSGHADSQT